MTLFDFCIVMIAILVPILVDVMIRLGTLDDEDDSC